MPGTMKQGRQRGQDPLGQSMQRIRGRISEAERRFLQDMQSGLSEGDRLVVQEMLRQSAPGIRGMNSQTRIDMLKNPKFRK